LCLEQNKMTYKSKNWCFTAYKELDYAKLPISYVIAGKELCPTTGKIHWQGYAQFTLRYTFEKVKEFMGVAGDDTCFVDRSKGNAKANIKYCSKDGDYIEKGVVTHQGQRSDLHEIAMELMKDPQRTILDVIEDDPAVYCQYRQGLNAIAEYSQIKRQKKNWRKIEEYYVEEPNLERAKDLAHFKWPDAYFLHASDIIKWRRYMAEDTICIIQPEFHDRIWLTRREPFDLKVSYGEKSACWSTVVYINPMKHLTSFENFDDEENVGKWWRLFTDKRVGEEDFIKVEDIDTLKLVPRHCAYTEEQARRDLMADYNAESSQDTTASL